MDDGAACKGVRLRCSCIAGVRVCYKGGGRFRDGAQSEFKILCVLEVAKNMEEVVLMGF